IVSAHHSITYLDRSIINRLPRRFYCTLDSEIDKIVPEDCRLYFPKAEDGLVYIEISPREMFTPGTSNHSLKTYCYIFWTETIHRRDYLRFFNRDVVFPLNRQSLPNRAFSSRAETEETKQLIRQELARTFPHTDFAQVVNGLHSLFIAEMHPTARDCH